MWPDCTDRRGDSTLSGCIQLDILEKPEVLMHAQGLGHSLEMNARCVSIVTVVLGMLISMRRSYTICTCIAHFTSL